MKHLLYPLIVLLSIGTLHAQSTSSAIENMEFNILYRGYENKIKIPDAAEGFANTLSGSNVSISKKDDYFIVKPGQGESAVLTVHRRGSQGEVQLIREKVYRIVNLPTPKLFWGTAQNGLSAIDANGRITVGYAAPCPLELTFEVESWEAEFNGKMHKGAGSEAFKLLNHEKITNETSKLFITALVKGPDGIPRKIKGYWFIEPEEEE